MFHVQPDALCNIHMVSVKHVGIFTVAVNISHYDRSPIGHVYISCTHGRETVNLCGVHARNSYLEFRVAQNELSHTMFVQYPDLFDLDAGCCQC